MDCTVHGVPKSRTRLSSFHFHFLNFTIFHNLDRPRISQIIVYVPFQRGNRTGALDLVGTSGAHDAINLEVTVKRKRSVGHL